MDVVYLDFSKAFDKMPHQRLIHKIDSHGIDGNGRLTKHGPLTDSRTYGPIKSP